MSTPGRAKGAPRTGGGKKNSFVFRFSPSYTVAEEPSNTTRPNKQVRATPVVAARSLNRSSAVPYVHGKGQTSTGICGAPRAVLHPSSDASAPAFSAAPQRDGPRNTGQTRNEQNIMAADSILHYNRQHKQNTTPVYMNGRTDDPCTSEFVTVNNEAIKPFRKPLQSPYLGLAAGVEPVSSQSSAFPLTANERTALLQKEREGNELLFQLWDERQATRIRNDKEATLETVLSGQLAEVVRDLLTTEEGYWLKDGRTEKLAASAVKVNPSTQSYRSNSGVSHPTSSPHHLVGSAMPSNGLTAFGATSRGIFVPVQKMESIFQEVCCTLHRRALSLLQTYNEGRLAASLVQTEDIEGIAARTAMELRLYHSCGDEGPSTPVTSGAGAGKDDSYLLPYLETERQLANAFAKGYLCVPSCVSIPPERALSPLVKLETAMGVTLLWKILEQARFTISGMDFALHIYTHYILPHLYTSFTAVSSVLPEVGGMSEQVMQLYVQPLRIQLQHSVSKAASQAQEDVHYMEYAMKRWAVRTWRVSLRARKRKEKTYDSIAGAFTKMYCRLTVRAVFDAWRLEARESAHRTYMTGIEDEYRTFLINSKVASHLAGPSILGEGIVSDVTGRRAKLVATSLATTAQHVKPPPWSRVSDPAPLPSAQHESAGAERVRQPPDNPDGNSGDSQTSRDSSNLTGTTRFFMLNDSTFTTNVEMFQKQSGGGDSVSLHTSPLADPLPGDTEDVVLAPESMSVRNAALLTVGPSTSADRGRGMGTLEQMLSNLKEMEEVCGHLRSEIAIQNNVIQKMDRRMNDLKNRNTHLEADLLRTVEEKLHFCNMVQEKEFQLREKDRRLVQLKSRIRGHRNRPWQRTLLRVVGDICGASTQASEEADNRRVQCDLKSGVGDSKCGTSGQPPGEDNDDEDELVTLSASAAKAAEEERLFGELAPIVLCSTSSLPDALVILRDWANNCLDDLEALDDLRGGALSLRFGTFSEEVSSGILLSRLLFYLALPRYFRSTANDEHLSAMGLSLLTSRGDVLDDMNELHPACDFADRRRQLLAHHNVQLETPFPTYSECFGDLLSMRPVERMALLLEFATELVLGMDAPYREASKQRLDAVHAAISLESGLSAPKPSSRVELHEMIDPHVLAQGERTSVITLVALLYCRFSHPFNHKCRQSAELEKAAMLYLLSDGQYVKKDKHASTPCRPHRSSVTVIATEPTTAEPTKTIADEMLACLDDEDKSPWQLFRERCLPHISNAAHPFLLRGNFWPSDAFDSPDLASILGALGMALNRSLQHHRWHVMTSCLVPVTSYSGLSRGVFTGPRASSRALRVGLAREQELNFALNSSPLMRIFDHRRDTHMARVAAGVVDEEVLLGTHSQTSNDMVASTATGALLIRKEKELLLQSVQVTLEDLLQLFLRRSTLSAGLGLPTMDLGSWRMLCADLKLISLEIDMEKNAILDIERVTSIYFEALMSARDPAKLVPINTCGPSTPQERLSPGRGDVGGLASEFLMNTEMTFTAFLTAVVLIADELYPLLLVGMAPEDGALHEQPSESARFPLPTVEPDTGIRPSASHSITDNASFLDCDGVEESTREKKERGRTRNALLRRPKAALWLGESLMSFVHRYVLACDGCFLSDTPRTILKRLTIGIGVQEVLSHYSPALIAVFQAYSKTVSGVAGILQADLLHLLRDAMLTSMEISQQLISDIFQHCCVTRRAVEDGPMSMRKEVDGRTRDLNSKARVNWNVGILGSNTTKVAPGTQKEVQVLQYDGFVEFLCVLCNIKQPNLLISMEQRLSTFLRRSLLRPLAQKVESLAPLLNRLRYKNDRRQSYC